LSLNWPSVLQAPTQFPLHESSLAIAALLATFGPPESLTQLAGSRPYLEGLLRVGRNSLRVAAEHLAGAPQAEPQYRAGCATMPGCPSVLAILAALAGTGVDPGWTALPLHWEFLRERPTLGLLRDVMLAAAQRSVLLDDLAKEVSCCTRCAAARPGKSCKARLGSAQASLA